MEEEGTLSPYFTQASTTSEPSQSSSETPSTLTTLLTSLTGATLIPQSIATLSPKGQARVVLSPFVEKVYRVAKYCVDTQLSPSSSRLAIHSHIELGLASWSSARFSDYFFDNLQSDGWKFVCWRASWCSSGDLHKFAFIPASLVDEMDGHAPLATYNGIYANYHTNQVAPGAIAYVGSALSSTPYPPPALEDEASFLANPVLRLLRNMFEDHELFCAEPISGIAGRNRTGHFSPKSASEHLCGHYRKRAEGSWEIARSCAMWRSPVAREEQEKADQGKGLLVECALILLHNAVGDPRMKEVFDSCLGSRDDLTFGRLAVTLNWQSGLESKRPTSSPLSLLLGDATILTRSRKDYRVVGSTLPPQLFIKSRTRAFFDGFYTLSSAFSSKWHDHLVGKRAHILVVFDPSFESKAPKQILTPGIVPLYSPASEFWLGVVLCWKDLKDSATGENVTTWLTWDGLEATEPRFKRLHARGFETLYPLALKLQNREIDLAAYQSSAIEVGNLMEEEEDDDDTSEKEENEAGNDSDEN